MKRLWFYGGSDPGARDSAAGGRTGSTDRTGSQRHAGTSPQQYPRADARALSNNHAPAVFNCDAYALGHECARRSLRPPRLLSVPPQLCLLPQSSPRSLQRLRPRSRRKGCFSG